MLETETSCAVVESVDAADRPRLDWLIEHEARVAPWRDGGWRVCRNWQGRIKWYGQPSLNPRAAIDSAMAGRWSYGK